MNAIVNTGPAMSIGESQEHKAITLANKPNAALVTAIATVVKAKEDWEGGKFVVMFAATADMSKEEIDELPIPGSKDGNNPAIYKVPRQTQNGTTEQEHNYYNVLSDNFPPNKAMRTELDMLELSLGDPAKVNMASVSQEIRDMDVTYRHTRISRLKGRINASRAAFRSAFELLHQIRAINGLPGVSAELIMALNPDGKTISETEVENTKTPIIVKSTVAGREAIDHKRVGIGTFMRMDAAKASENGGTFQALENTIKREKKKDEVENKSDALPQKIATLDTFKARVTDVHDFMDTIWSSKDKALYATLLKTVGPKTAGNGDFVLSLYQIYNMLGDVFGHDAIRAHAEKLNELDATSAAA